MSFLYPAYFKFEVGFRRGTDVPVRWDLEGLDVDITVFKASSRALGGEKGNRGLSTWVAKLFEGEVIEREATALALRQLKLLGRQYTVPINAGAITAELQFEAYELPGEFGSVRYFLLISGRDGENLEEEALVTKLLRKSFKITREPAKAE